MGTKNQSRSQEGGGADPPLEMIVYTREKISQWAEKVPSREKSLFDPSLKKFLDLHIILLTAAFDQLPNVWDDPVT